MMRLFCFIIIFLGLSSCNSQSANLNNQNVNNTAKKMIHSEPENSIVFLFFEVEKNSDGTEKVSHTATKIAKGKVKTNSIENFPNKNGNILISMISKNGDIVEERIIENPLNPMMEVYIEQGISQEKISLNKAEFSIRFNQEGNIEIVKIEKITENSRTILATVKL